MLSFNCVGIEVVGNPVVNPVLSSKSSGITHVVSSITLKLKFVGKDNNHKVIGEPKKFEIAGLVAHRLKDGAIILEPSSVKTIRGCLTKMGSSFYILASGLKMEKASEMGRNFRTRIEAVLTEQTKQLILV